MGTIQNGLIGVHADWVPMDPGKLHEEENVTIQSHLMVEWIVLETITNHWIAQKVYFRSRQ